MKRKNGIGAKNPIDILVVSAITPITGGKTAPPTIDITIKDDAFFVFGPRSFMPREKIVGNIIDIKKKTPYKLIREIQPSPALTKGNRIQHIKA